MNRTPIPYDDLKMETPIPDGDDIDFKYRKDLKQIENQFNTFYQKLGDDKTESKKKVLEDMLKRVEKIMSEINKIKRKKTPVEMGIEQRFLDRIEKLKLKLDTEFAKVYKDYLENMSNPNANISEQLDLASQNMALNSKPNPGSRPPSKPSSRPSSRASSPVSSPRSRTPPSNEGDFTLSELKSIRSKDPRTKKRGRRPLENPKKPQLFNSERYLKPPSKRPPPSDYKPKEGDFVAVGRPSKKGGKKTKKTRKYKLKKNSKRKY